MTGDRSAAGSAGPIASPYVPQVPLHLVASAPKGGATVLSSRGVLHPSAHLSATEGAPKRSTGLLGRLGRRATKDTRGARVARASSEERRSRASSDEEVEDDEDESKAPKGHLDNQLKQKKQATIESIGESLLGRLPRLLPLPPVLAMLLDAARAFAADAPAADVVDDIEEC